MNANVVIGLVAYIAVAAAFAAFWERIIHRGFVAPIVAAACTASVALAMDYVATDQMNAYAVPLFGVLFTGALVVAMAVHLFRRRRRVSQARIDV